VSKITEQTTSEEMNIILKIKTNLFEISTEGTIDELKLKIDDLIEFIVNLNEKLDEKGIVEEIMPVAEEDIPTEEEIETAPVENIPVIKPSRSTMDNIIAMFNTDWGKKPRSVAEVMKALEINAVPDQASTVSTYLRRLVKRGILRRIQVNGLWHYYKLPTE